MNRIISLFVLACLTGCASSGSPASSRTPPVVHSKPSHCALWPGGYGLCMHTCAHENAMAQARTAQCQASPPDNKPAGCELAGMDAGQYGACIGRCAAMPTECQ